MGAAEGLALGTLQQRRSVKAQYDKMKEIIHLDGQFVGALDNGSLDGALELGPTVGGVGC